METLKLHKTMVNTYLRNEHQKAKMAGKQSFVIVPTSIFLDDGSNLTEDDVIEFAGNPDNRLGLKKNGSSMIVVVAS